MTLSAQHQPTANQRPTSGQPAAKQRQAIYGAKEGTRIPSVEAGFRSIWGQNGATNNMSRVRRSATDPSFGYRSGNQPVPPVGPPNRVAPPLLMTAPIAHLKTHEILKDLETAYSSSPFYIERDLQYAQFSRKARDVYNVSPGEGIVLRACLDALLGDVQAIEADYDSLLATKHDKTDLFNLAVAFSTVGCFSKAQSILRPIVTAKSGELSSGRDRAYSLGLFHHIASQYAEAQDMNLDLSHGLESEAAKLAAIVLERAGISDDDVSKQLDAAGLVMQRNRRLLGATSFNSVFAPDELEAVVMQILVEAPPSTLFDLNVELAETVIELGLPVHPNFVLSFGHTEDLDR